MSVKPKTIHIVSMPMKTLPNTIKSLSTLVRKKQNGWTIVDIIQETSISNNAQITTTNNVILVLIIFFKFSI